MRGVHRLRRIATRLRRWGKPTAAILLYHRVVELERDPQWLAVAPQRFRTQMEILSGKADIVPLAELPARLAGARTPGRPLVAVTFDDGYADNLAFAAPVLEAAGVPATVFVATGFTGSGREFFWDDLERLVLAPEARLPGRLVVPLGTSQRVFELPSEQLRECGPSGWNATMQVAVPRHSLYLELCRAMGDLGHAERCRALDAVRSQVGGDPAARPSHRVLNPDEIRRLDASSAARIGSHTRWHLRLSAQPAGIQGEEIGAARTDLEGILGRPVREMAYPFGSLVDHDHATRATAASAGFSIACSNHPDLAWRGSDPFALPRFLIRDWDGPEFTARLGAFLGG